MWSTFFAAIAPVVLGAAGWFLTHFLLKPFLDFRKLRADMHEELIYSAHIATPQLDGDRYHRATESLRRLAAKLAAKHVAAVEPLPSVLAMRGYDAERA